MEQNHKILVPVYRVRNVEKFDICLINVEPYDKQTKQTKAWRWIPTDERYDLTGMWFPYMYVNTKELFVSQEEAEEYCRIEVQRRIAETKRRIVRLERRLEEFESNAGSSYIGSL